ncbi:MAG TPA: dihydrofolate reductase family protein, partial [Hyphomicrobiaceae bacterium]|nr:dihydrofolate reductase family protein [Hyphomicrobiaceae bacterium]
AERESALVARGATVVRTAATSTGRLDLAAVLQYLSETGLTRVLVEGGTTVLGGFLDRLADELVVIQSPDRLPPAVRLRPFGDRMIGDLARLGWRVAGSELVGPDTLTTYRPEG